METPEAELLLVSRSTEDVVLYRVRDPSVEEKLSQNS
jgi:hypothetical protein